MAKYYRRRYRKRGNDSGGLVTVLMLIAIAYGYPRREQIESQIICIVSIASFVVAVSLVTIVVFWWCKRQRTRAVYSAYSLANIDTMDGLEFERYLADLLRRRGYTGIKLTEYYDYGVDIIARKDGVTWGIQAKRYSGLVKVSAVRQAYTALPTYKCDRAMVISNNYYNHQAIKQANDTNTVLVDREKLMQWVYEAQTIKT